MRPRARTTTRGTIALEALATDLLPDLERRHAMARPLLAAVPP
jgi:hypothetical protein